MVKSWFNLLKVSEKSCNRNCDSVLFSLQKILAGEIFLVSMCGISLAVNTPVLQIGK